jgi:hypothetical protein
MSKFGQPLTTGGQSSFGDGDGGPSWRKCRYFRLRLRLDVEYEKDKPYLTPIGGGDWEGEVKLKAILAIDDLSDHFDCDTVGHVDNPRKCPTRCQYELMENNFNGTYCLTKEEGFDPFDVNHAHCKKTTKDLGFWLSRKPCSAHLPSDKKTACDWGDFPGDGGTWILRKVLGVKAHCKLYCKAHHYIICDKRWITCDPERELVEFFGTDGGEKSIDFNQMPGGGEKGKALTAYKVLETIGKYNALADAAAAGGDSDSAKCSICKYLCCLFQAMAPTSSYNGKGGDVGCNKEDCGTIGGILPASLGGCEAKCGEAWEMFLSGYPCQPKDTAGDDSFTLLWNGDGTCIGCCGEDWTPTGP